MDVDDEFPPFDVSNKKRRHPESSTMSSHKTSFEILQLVEHPNFEELARWNPFFQRAWEMTRQEQKQMQKTFSACVSQEFTIALTRALLKTHLELQLPYLESNHLCPPVPNRFFYLHWIHNELLRGSEVDRFGMDIGAGATAIYSLLAAKFFQYHMFTTEIDEIATTMAQKNVDANHLSSRIHIASVEPSHSQDPNQPVGGPLERSLVAWDQFLAQGQQQPMQLDFVMTNPPFYDPSTMEYKNPRAGDGRARTAMTVSEGSYPGGEVGFVIEMIADSLRRRHSSRWFSSMLGKKTSLLQLQKLLTHVLGPAHVRVTEYGPGQYTRWFLAWTMANPSAIEPSARVCLPENIECFRIALPEGTMNPTSEVVSRIITYCESSPGGWTLTVTPLLNHSGPQTLLQLQEVNPLPVVLFVDESDQQTEQVSIPSTILEALHGEDNSQLLPPEGHFVVHVTVEATSPNECQVHLAGYRHSSRGQAAIKKIGSTIQGDVCRSNRYWRRKLQRQIKG